MLPHYVGMCRILTPGGWFSRNDMSVPALYAVALSQLLIIIIYDVLTTRTADQSVLVRVTAVL